MQAESLSHGDANPLQRTAKWFSDRCGCLTASRAADALAISAKTGKPLKSRLDLIDTLIAERATGVAQSSGTTWAMQWGIDHEVEAREAYEAATGEMVDLVGFIPHPDIPWFGASPDGLVGSDGLVEIKCPQTVTHLRRIAAGVPAPEYLLQMDVQLICTGRKWCDYVDYDPRLEAKNPELTLFIRRYEPAPEHLAGTLEACRVFLAEVDSQYRKLMNLGERREQNV